MTPDIQELRRLAEAASATSGRGCPHWTAYIAAASPSTILALIEIAEAAEDLAESVYFVGDEYLQAANGYGRLQDKITRLRTALEGVKK